MNDLLDIVFSERFIPHGYCFMWRPELVWMHVLSDLVIALAYFSIPVTIMFFVNRSGRVLPYVWIFRMFAAFIFLCGMTHLVDVIAVWRPIYYLEGLVKMFTAAVSLATAVMMFPLIPVVLRNLAEEDGTHEAPVDKTKDQSDLKQD